jgi:hypothetical protein
LDEDGLAANPAIHFGVESFEPAEGFTPSKPYRSRLLWRDFDGDMQSKLLLSAPETVLAIVVKGNRPAEDEKPATQDQNGAPRASRRRRRRQQPAAEPA